MNELLKRIRAAQIPLWAHRSVALLLVLVLSPAILSIPSFSGEAPLVEGEPASRTVLAPTSVRVADEEATLRARRQAADTVSDVLVFDEETQARVVRRIADVFQATEEVREPIETPTVELPQAQLFDEKGERVELPPPPPPEPPEPDEQIEALEGRFSFIDQDLATALVGLSDRNMSNVENQTTEIVQQLARQQITEEQIEARVRQELSVELNIRTLPADSATEIVGPLVRAVMLPTVTIDRETTDERQQEAADAVSDITRAFPAGSPVVESGQVIDPIQMAALSQLGLEGSDGSDGLFRAVLLMLAAAVATGLYLRFVAHRLWVVGRKLLVLASLITTYAAMVAAVSYLTDMAGSVWWFVLPANAVTLLATLLLGPAVGVALVLPVTLMPLAVDPSAAYLAVYAATSALVAVPFVARVESRAGLRTATMKAGMAASLVAALATVTGTDLAPQAAFLVGLAGGVITALVVNGLLPFLESAFRLPTVTTLLDLADRNHPLLRELEAEALGSYNHSVTVATLVERACRKVGANALLGSVAALYHDIGKVRQPVFFVENQQGISNPHNDLEPQVSALIIHKHVSDGVEMATEHRIPPEVVACIASHHGTMLVKYFYDQAKAAADDPDSVDEEDFRYKGTKPRSKEAAIVMLADCCEATTRSMAMNKGNLTAEEIESTVEKLFTERVDDGQLDDAQLTFAELTQVKRSLIEALGGIYHPRISYPGQDGYANTNVGSAG